jgi:tRNA(Ile)-lysidine synthase
MTETPIRDDALAALFRPLEAHAHWGLAVSGGPDSMALMQLVARRLARSAAGKKATVLTVDHGLRAVSGAEAAFVARAAASLGLRHATLHWEGAKPRTGIQAAARAARYDLMAEYAHGAGIDCLVTAHHLDDQAETLLMRLGRGSGLDGLAGIPEIGGWAGLPVVRPLLEIPSGRLKATLKAARLDWIEDPSNEDSRFERVAVRKAMATLEGLGYTAASLAAAARRLARARAALDQATTDFLETVASVSEAGYCTLDRARFAAAPDEIALRALSRLLEAVRGGEAALSLARLESLTERMRSGDEAARTLAGCRIVPRADSILILREAGRGGLGELRLEPGEEGLWDRRFHVAAPRDAGAPVTVRALGRAGARELRARAGQPVRLPAAAAATLVSFWRGGDLVSVPPLGFHAGGSGGERYTARFVNAQPFQDVALR